MYAPLAIIAGLAGLGAADISCGAPLSTGTLWYSNVTTRFLIGQLGIVEARGNAEFLAKYPSNNVQAHTVQVLPCNSTYLAATIPGPGPATIRGIPVILQLADGTENCLAPESQGRHDIAVTKQKCQYGENSAQVVQFWTQDQELGVLFPRGGIDTSERWNIVFNPYSTNELITHPPPAPCYPQGACTTGQDYSLIVKEES
jgi:hypothetical protein